MEPVLCSLEDAGKALNLGRTKIYEMLADGTLESVRIGRRRLVRVASVHALAGAKAA